MSQTIMTITRILFHKIKIIKFLWMAVQRPYAEPFVVS